MKWTLAVGIIVTLLTLSGATARAMYAQSPVANDDSYAAQENQALSITAPGVLSNDTDTLGDPLTAVLVTEPGHGSLSLNANGSLTYTPNSAFLGADTFTYQAKDTVTESVSDIGTVTVTTAAFSSVCLLDGTDGSSPTAALVEGSDGNLYGTATGKGVYGNFGTIFQVTPAGTLTNLHSFDVTDGNFPSGSLVQGSDGNFYGTTGQGAYGYGTIFKISPAGILTTVHSFIGSDGAYPYAGLVLDGDGNFYGTTQAGGASGNGTVFKIRPGGTLTTLHSFTASDGSLPTAGLVQGSDGNFYGTTQYGGASGNGTVFEISPGGALTTLHSFTGSDGANPVGGVVQGSDGNFYGATSSAGAHSGGTVFELTPAGALTTLHSFTGSDGANPQAGLLEGSDGNFYGTTVNGGASQYYGTVFEITPAGVLTTLHSFTGPPSGANSYAGLLQGSDGNLYGTTRYGGIVPGSINNVGYGTVFELDLALPVPAPMMPASLTATAGPSEVTLNWTGSPGATVYRVYRSVTSNGEANPALADGLANTGYTDTRVTSGVTYFYKVTAANSDGASGFSNEARATPFPLAPVSLTATAAMGGVAPVTLAWTASAGATGYNVYRGTTEIGSTGPTTAFSDSTVVAAGVNVSYTVRAVNAGGASAASNTATVLLAPGSPASLTATAADNSVTLNWNPSAGTVVYRVYRSTTSGAEKNPALAGAIGTTSYTDTAAANGAVYYYKVTAVNIAGASQFSGEAGPAAPDGPVAPTLVSVTAAVGGIGPIALDWTDGSGALVYRVYRSTMSNGEANPALQGGLATMNYTDTSTLTAGATYYYRVIAVNVGGASTFSNEKFATLTPSPPTNLTATAATGGVAPVNLAWTASAGATGYSVYRGTIEVASTGATPAFTDTTVVPAGVRVGYAVTAVNAGGTSAKSATAVALLAPAPPSNPTCTPGFNQVTLHWTASAGALVYRVYRSTTSGGEATPALAGGIEDTIYTDTSAVNSTEYYYVVTAVNNAGASGFSSQIVAVPGSAAPVAPTLVSATTAAGGAAPITLNWTAVASAAVYRVYRSTTPGGEANPALAGGIRTTNYTDTAVTTGVTYYYKVTAVNTGGVSGFSNQRSATLTPATPINLVATATAGGVAPVTLTWNACSGATGYTVYRGTVEIGSVTAPTAGFTDTTVVPAGIDVSYTVTAVNAGGTSQPATVTVLLGPSAPLNLVATAGSNQIILNWAADAGAVVYRVYRSTSSGGEVNPALAGGIGTTIYTDTTAVNGITYYYKVTSVSTAGASEFSNESGATAGTTAAPTNLTAAAAPGGLTPITLAWSASPGAIFYRVYRGTASNGEGRLALAAGATVGAYTDTAVRAGTTYYYKVTAVNNLGASALSNEASATLTPATPSDLTATAAAGPTVDLAWNPSIGAVIYNVYRGSASGQEAYYAATSGAAYTDTSVYPGTTYFYYVEAVNAGGASGYSSEARVLTN